MEQLKERNKNSVLSVTLCVLCGKKNLTTKFTKKAQTTPNEQITK